MKDRPDAVVWRDADGTHYLCAHCVETAVRNSAAGIGAAMRAATAHLWRVHGLRRVWLDESRPELSRSAQMAFDIAVPHQTQFDRSW